MKLQMAIRRRGSEMSIFLKQESKNSNGMQRLHVEVIRGGPQRVIVMLCQIVLWLLLQG
jgi:hypothetical protein